MLQKVYLPNNVKEAQKNRAKRVCNDKINAW